MCLETVGRLEDLESRARNVTGKLEVEAEAQDTTGVFKRGNESAFSMHAKNRLI